MRSSSSTRAGLFIATAALGLVAACGSRGPLDQDDGLVVGGDAGNEGGGSSAVDASDDAATIDTGGPVRLDGGADARPGGPISCGLCVAETCGTPILQCVTNPACAQTFQCVTGSCLAGGKLDPACLVKCASGDPSSALKLFEIFQCLTTKCGPDCASILALLGGLGGGPSIDGGGKMTPPAPKEGDAERDFIETFSRWPVLVSRGDQNL